MFQYGRENIEIAKKDRHTSCDNSENEDEDDGDEGKREKKEKDPSDVTSHYLNQSNHMLHKMDKKLKNGVLTNNSTSVISRDDMILVPDPEQNYVNANTTSCESDHTAVIHVCNPLLEYMLSDIQSFVK
jgi:hypothetical protein